MFRNLKWYYRLYQTLLSLTTRVWIYGSANNIESDSIDVISSLQDKILAKILSFLPTKQAASTSVLSRRWRNLVPLMNLLFASQHHYHFDDSELLHPPKKRRRVKRNNSFDEFLDKTLSGGNSSIQKLSLKCKDDQLCSDFADGWIHKALQRGIVDFELRLAREANLLPPSVLINKTLVKLTLGLKQRHRYERIVLKQVCLPVLKSLVLHTDCCIHDLLSSVMLPGCPILEELSLHYSRIDHPYEYISISHNTFKRLTVHDHIYRKYHFFLEKFDTPSLAYFDYSGYAPLIPSPLGFTASLIEAKLDVPSDVMYNGYAFLCHIFNWMPNVKVLSLTSASVEMMWWSWLSRELPLFANLVKLSFESKIQDFWTLLPRLLNKSPKLENLVPRDFHQCSS